MEETQKKIKKDNKTSKVSDTKKVPKTTKTSTTKKEVASKTSSAKKTTTATKTSTTKKETTKPKTTSSKKTTGTTKTTNKRQTTPKEPKINKEENIKKIDTEDINVSENKASSNTNAKVERKQKKEEKTNDKKDKVVIANAQKEETVVKKQIKEKKNKKEKQKDKANTQNKKHIDISLGAILAVAIILILLIVNIKLGISAYNVIKEDKPTKDESTNTNIQSDNSNEIQEIGQVLNLKDEIVSKIIEKMTFSTNATASIYKAGAFSEDTISNDLKLRIGWARVKEENKLHSIQASGKSIIAVEKEIMDESIKDVFGKEVEYDAKPFNNVDATEFAAYEEVQGMINYDNELYMGAAVQNEAVGTSPLIYQEIQKVVQYTSGKIKISVKTAFADVKDGKYIIYQEYKDGFNNQLLEIIPEELFKNTLPNQLTGEGTITADSNEALNSIRGQLNTYTYTFEFDDATDKYYLTEFNKEINKE